VRSAALGVEAWFFRDANAVRAGAKTCEPGDASAGKVSGPESPKTGVQAERFRHGLFCLRIGGARYKGAFHATRTQQDRVEPNRYAPFKPALCSRRRRGRHCAARSL